MALLHLDEVDSTNRYALDNASALSDLTLITADSQSDGRGRQGRAWVSPPDCNLYATWLLKSWPYPPYQATWLASVALLDTIKEFAPELEVRIKWPNDLIVGHRKLAGLLAECRTDSNGAVIALGMGVNLNMAQADLDVLPTPAISVFSDTGLKINRSFFNKRLAFHLISWYLIGLHSGIRKVFKEWRRNNAFPEGPAIFIDPRGCRSEGVVRDVTFEGEIVIDTAEGIRSFQCGDITLDRNSFQSIIS